MDKDRFDNIRAGTKPMSGRLTEFVKKPTFREIGLLYESNCEKYDRVVCTGLPRGGKAYPANREEVTLINRHARKVFAEFMNLYQLTREQIKEAVRSVQVS